MASPVKNVHVVALHAISSVLKSLVSMGVTNNPSRPIHHQGMFYHHYFILALSAHYTTQKPDLLIDDREWNGQEFHVFPLGLFINLHVCGTPFEYGVA